MYKEPRYNKKGQPICELCEVGYDRLLQHVAMRHTVTAAAYKKEYGLNPRKGIQSDRLRIRMRKTTLKNYNKVILQNLIIGGKGTRFAEGNKMTNKELVSRNARETMNAYWEGKREPQEEVVATLIKKLSSGIGNIHATN